MSGRVSDSRLAVEVRHCERVEAHPNFKWGFIGEEQFVVFVFALRDARLEIEELKKIMAGVRCHECGKAHRGKGKWHDIDGVCSRCYNEEQERTERD